MADHRTFRPAKLEQVRLTNLKTIKESAQAVIDLFVWEPDEQTGEVTPHLDRQTPHLYDALTRLRDALARG
jgi:hypothetical protein